VAVSDQRGPGLHPVAAAAAAEAGSSSKHSSKGPQLGEVHAAQKPSRIPLHPGQPPKLDHVAATPSESNTAALGSSAVATSTGPTLDTLTDVCDTAAAAGTAVAGPSSNGSAAVSNGNSKGFQAETSNIQQVGGLSCLPVFSLHFNLLYSTEQLSICAEAEQHSVRDGRQRSVLSILVRLVCVLLSTTRCLRCRLCPCSLSSLGHLPCLHIPASVTKCCLLPCALVLTYTPNIPTIVSLPNPSLHLPQQQLQAQHLRSATLAESSDWSQDSSTTSSEVSSQCPAGPSSSKPGGSTKSSSSKEQRPHQQQQQQNGVHIQQQVGSDTLPLQLSDPQQQQQAQVQQQHLGVESCCGLTDQPGPPLQQCLQDSLVNSGPGPRGSTGAGGSTSIGGSTAVAAAAAAAAAGVAGGQSDGLAAAAVDRSAVRARMSADPDYELPQGICKAGLRLRPLAASVCLSHI
jgi:hypothetical protein